MQFQVLVYSINDFDWSKRPSLTLVLRNQEITVGDEMAIYKPAYSVVTNGWNYEIQVNLGRSNKFVRFDKDNFVFTTKADMVELIDVGDHEVRITAIFS